ncbi:MAG: UbiA family prenyltransferase [Candidatus Hydrothermia bacterium]
MSVLVSFYVAGILKDCSVLLVFAIPIVLLAAFSNVLNDIMDYELDKKAHPQRPLPRGEVNQVEAFIFLLLILALYVVSIFFLPSIRARFFMVLGIFLAFLYDLFLKRLPFLGNFAVSLLTSFPFLIVAVAFDKFSRLWYPVICAIFYNLAREAVKDAEDFEHDREFGYKTIPLFFGLRGTKIYAASLFFALFILTMIAFKMGFGGWLFFAYMSLMWIFLILLLFVEKSLSRLSKVFKAFMILIIAGFLIGGVS